MKRTIIPILLITILFTAFLHAELDLVFEQIGKKHGLSNHKVTAIFQDKRGYLWVGSLSGLNRYDGKKFRHYFTDPSAQDAMPTNLAMSIFEDSSGRLLIGTGFGGISIYDEQQNQIQHLRFKNPKTTLDKTVDINFLSTIAIAEDPTGALWLGTHGAGLIRVDPKSGESRRFTREIDGGRTISSNRIRDLLIGSEGNLWIATAGGGLNRYHLKDKTFSHYLSDTAMADSISSNGLNCLYEDSRNNLWIGTGYGLDRYDRNQARFIHHRFDPQDPESISNNVVTRVYEDRSGVLWVGTSNGLNRMHPEKNRFARIFFKRNGETNIGSNWIRAILEDRSGVLWIGTDNGLQKYSKYAMKFHNYDKTPSVQSFNNRAVSALNGEGKYLWIAVNNTLKTFEIDRNQNSLRLVQADRIGTAPSVLNSIFRFDHDHLWLGSSAGIHTYNVATRTVVKRLTNSPDSPLRLSDNRITSMLKGSDGLIWIASRNGLTKIDLKKNLSTRYYSRKADEHALCSNTITDICEDSSQNIWIGTDWGLNLYLPGKDRFKRFVPDPDRPGAINNKSITSIHESRDNYLWIGTFGGGLNRFEYDSQTFSAMTTKNGLPDNMVRTIFEDGQYNLWIVTGDGLSRFDTRQKRFKNYNILDGLMESDFLNNRFYRDSSGTVYLGGKNGLTYFNPDRIRYNERIPEIRINEIRLNNIPVQTPRPGSPISVSHQVKTIAIEFAALDFHYPHRNQYRYRFEERDMEWVDLRNENQITFHSLPPGNYRLRIIGSNHDAVWNREGILLPISVLPPFWKTAWFRAILLMLVLLLLFQLYRVRIRKIEKRYGEDLRLEKFLIKKNVSEKEKEVIALILEGCSNKDIEDKLFISYGTVKNHVYNIFKKLDVKSRVQLISVMNRIKKD